MEYDSLFCFSINVLYLFSSILCSQNFDGISPEEYVLLVEPDLNNLAFQGEVSIHFSIVNATKQLSLNAQDLKNKEIKLMSSNESESSEINVGFMENDGSWLLFTVGDLVGGYILNISFTGHLSSMKEEEGFLYNKYIDNETEKMYADFKNRPWTTRRLFPSLDCPSSPTPFTAQIARDPVYSTLCSMELKKASFQQDSAEDKVWDTFYNPNISISQVEFIVHQLSNVSTAEFTLLAKSEALDQTNKTITLLPAIAGMLSKWFPSQPIAEITIVALPDGDPEMVFYPGLVFCREDQILFKQTVSNSKSQQLVMKTAVKIIVRQLLWEIMTEENEFSEGLATYLEEKILYQLEPTTTMSEAYYMDVLKEEISVSYEETDNSQNKVAGALRMIFDDFSLNETVITAITQLLNERKPVTAEDFFPIIDQLVASADLPSNFTCGKILQAWILQGDWPIVTITMNDSVISITQMSSTKTNATWPIPLSFQSDVDFANKVNHSHRIWLTESFYEVPQVHGSSKWVVFDGPSGLYRVNYDYSGWQTLGDQLMANHSTIPPEMRSRLIDDVFYLAERQLVTYELVFHLTQYLANETDYLPWKTAASNIEKLRKLFFGTKLAFDIQEHVKSLYLPYFEKAYRITSMNESRIEQLASRETLFWGCHWGLQSCFRFTSELFKQWLSVSTRFPPDYKPAALCTGVMQNPEMFMEVFDAFTQSSVEGDRLVFLTALACTKNTSHIHFILELVFLDEDQIMIGHHNKMPLVRHILGFPENIATVTSFLQCNYDKAVDVVGSKMMSSVWSEIGRNVYSQQDILLIQTIAGNASVSVGLRDSLGSVLETARANQKLASDLAPLVTAGLSRHWTMTCSSAQSLSLFNVPSLFKITLLLLVYFFNSKIFTM